MNWRHIYRSHALRSSLYKSILKHVIPLVLTGSTQMHAEMQTFQVFKTWKV
jgi:hypothetical protein